MAKAVKQFRFYTEKEDSATRSKNYPLNTTISDYSSGAVFDNIGCFPILQLGIQALPGTKIYLNEGTEAVVIGSTGIYELDLDGLAEIVKLQFDYTSLQIINDNDTACLIVDIIWDDGTAEQED